MPNLHRLVLGCLLLVCLHHAAVAEESRSISAKGGTSTCLGRPETPLCAIDTFYGCFWLARADLCAAVGVSLLSTRPRRDELHYYVDERAGETDDEVVIEARTDICFPGPFCRYFDSSEFLLHQKDGHWRVAKWTWRAYEDVASRRIVTSRCLGNRASPVCVLETYFACVMGGDAARCRQLVEPARTKLCLRGDARLLIYQLAVFAFAPERREVSIMAKLRECADGARWCEPEREAQFRLASRRSGWTLVQGADAFCGDAP